jgi:hypothetical protein
MLLYNKLAQNVVIENMCSPYTFHSLGSERFEKDLAGRFLYSLLHCLVSPATENWTFVFSQDLGVEVLTLDVTVLRGKGSEMKWGYVGRAPLSKVISL